ncbi:MULTISPECIES: ABC transporter ATP-binding protein [unclassified Nitratiruptor]|uniref:ABC transporter ATP-binding protein n=1 Tax=unclassified Nitratiruptor TaxID=2624044 RepID=UPI0018EDA838|nr:MULTISPECIES: ABC transporter ATP-binding protein [unclassified Nitratiruptor]BCD61147.1 NitT/TauT family transport system ATP-binding protein [Nitratiruptor sp. YY08-10]BCD65080.1 NitT/TauT family transport system ATP-binding protein [Nitratiruptor sp. YY08-14]
MARLKVEHLTFSFGYKTILEDISFEIDEGEVVSVVGPSGGGKTTLLRLCAGLLDRQEGTIENSFKTQAIAFQDARLLPWKNVLDNIAFGLKAQGVSKKERIKRAKEIALKFDLEEDDFEKFPKELSGGMSQRVSFARALVTKPELLFLDEPFSALDIGLKRELQNHLIELIDKKEITIFFITHDLMEAVKLSDKIFVLEPDPGRIVKTFTIDIPQSKRDDSYVYSETAKLLQDPYIIETFELE